VRGALVEPDLLDPLADVLGRPQGHLLAELVRHLLADQPERLRGEPGRDGVRAAGHLLQRFDGVDLAEYARLALLLLDAGLHAEVERGQVARLLADGAEHRDQPLQPVVALAVRVRQVRLGELGRRVRRDERVDQVERLGLEHGRLDLLVGHQHGDGQERVVLDVVVRVEREREQPRGHVPLYHQLLVLGAAVQRQVGQRPGAVPQGRDVPSSALVQQHVQTAEPDHVAARHLAVLEQVLEDPCNTAAVEYSFRGKRLEEGGKIANDYATVRERRPSRIARKNYRPTAKNRVL